MQVENNFWFKEKSARAFWDQKHGRPYSKLLADTLEWCEPKQGETWLDIGCGGGQLSSGLIRMTDGKVKKIIATDCAEVNAEAIAKLRFKHGLDHEPERLSFCQSNLSEGLPKFETQAFDGVVAGLSLSYAESKNPITGEFDDSAFRNIFKEIYRVLKPGGRLVFSINVPDPNFIGVFLQSMWPLTRWGKPFRLLTNSIKMYRVTGWLKKESRKGRFHYLPIGELLEIVKEGGLEVTDWKISYAKTAYVVRAFRPGSNSNS